MGPKIKFFIGKGGVGESTTSALTALNLAHLGHHTLLVSMEDIACQFNGYPITRFPLSPDDLYGLESLNRYIQETGLFSLTDTKEAPANDPQPLDR